MLRQHSTLVAEAIVAAEAARMMGDAGGSAATVTVGDLIAKYRLDWGTYRQGKKHRSVAAQHLRAALRNNPLLAATTERRDKYVVYTLLGATECTSSPQTKSANASLNYEVSNWTTQSATTSTPIIGTSSLSTRPSTASSER